MTRPGSYDATVYGGRVSRPTPVTAVTQARAATQAPPPSRARVPEKWLTVDEVAAELRVSNMTVYRLIHAGELASITVRRQFRVTEKALDAYIWDQEHQA